MNFFKDLQMTIELDLQFFKKPIFTPFSDAELRAKLLKALTHRSAPIDGHGGSAA